MYIIGDVHGNLNGYEVAIRDKERTVQLGDFGFKKEHDWHLNNVDPKSHSILFGNHDYYPYLDHEHSLGNWKYISEFDVFFVRGADSIDKSMRTEGRDWFSEEEMSYAEFSKCIDEYEKQKPDVVVSHDAPQSIVLSFFGIPDKSITRSALDQMFEIHKPNIWIFGHHHTSINSVVFGTYFICLDELESFKI